MSTAPREPRLFSRTDAPTPDARRLRSMRARCLFALAIMAGLVAGRHFAMNGFVRGIARDSQLLALVARERFLISRCARFASLLVVCDPRDRQSFATQFEQIAADLAATHRTIVEGDPSRDIPPLSADLTQVMLDEPHRISERLRSYVATLRTILAAAETSAPEDSGARFMESVPEHEQLLQAADAFFSLAHEKSRQQFARRDTLATVFLWTQLAVIALTGVFVLEPMVRRIRRETRQLEDANATLEKRSEELRGTLAELTDHRDALQARSGAMQNLMDDLQTERERLQTEVAERQRAEQRATEHAERIRAIVETAVDAIITIDDLGVIESANPATESLFGYSPTELIGTNISALMPAPYQAEHDGYLRNYRDTGVRKIIGIGREVVGQRKDGSTFALDLAVSEMYLGNRRMFTGILRDASERKRAQSELARHVEELDRQNLELAAKNRELDEFTYAASHDLQEPLRKMISFSKLLETDVGGDLPEAARKDVEFITSAAHRMQRLVRDLLALSRCRRSEITIEPVALNQCIDQAIDQLSARIEETGAEVTRDELPIVQGDCTLLTQLYQNLLGNALKFVAPGQSPRIHLTVEHSGDETILGVRDHGIGLDPVYAEQIFRPFKRLHGRNEYEGSGIGLAICQKAVERLGGRIWVESQLGQGAHFRFTLKPLREEHPWSIEAGDGREFSSSKMIPAIRS